MASCDGQSAEMYGARKAGLLSSLQGTVVEIGPGTGVNLDFMRSGTRWIGLEPNLAMHPHIRRKAAALGMQPDLRACPLDDAGLAAGSADAVISTLVLCSVPSVPQLLRQVREVLRPGGVFIFLEHVADAPRTLRRLVQKTMPFTPWRFLSDGCNPGRDIGAAIRAAGFAEVEMEAFMQPGPGLILAINRPHIAGRAVK